MDMDMRFRDENKSKEAFGIAYGRDLQEPWRNHLCSGIVLGLTRQAPHTIFISPKTSLL